MGHRASVVKSVCDIAIAGEGTGDTDEFFSICTDGVSAVPNGKLAGCWLIASRVTPTLGCVSVGLIRATGAAADCLDLGSTDRGVNSTATAPFIDWLEYVVLPAESTCLYTISPCANADNAPIGADTNKTCRKKRT